MSPPILTLSLSLFTSPLSAWVADKPSSADIILFERAVQLEEVEHDWESAASIYNRLYGLPSALSVEAGIRFTRCQLKLGKGTDAENSLQGLADRLRKERQPKEIASPAPEVPADLQQRLEAAMKEIESSTGVDRTRLVEAAIAGMAQTMSANSGYMSSEELARFSENMSDHWEGIGAVLAGGDRITVKATIEGSPAEKAGIPLETEILEIDGKTPFALGGKLEDIVKTLRGPAGTSVKLRVKFPGGEPKELTLVRSRLKVNLPGDCSPVLPEKFAPTGPIHYWLNEAAGIAGIALHHIEIDPQNNKDTAKNVQALLTSPPFSEGKVKGFVLDLWDNGGGYAEGARQIADLFLKEGIIAAEKSKDDIRTYKADAAELLPGVPIVVVVNRHTASSGEVIAAALQDNRRATVIGERTFGRGEILTLKNLPGGGALKVPVGEWLRPSGHALQRREGMNDKDSWGVTPDVPVPPLTAPVPGSPEKVGEASHITAVYTALEYLMKPHAAK